MQPKTIALYTAAAIILSAAFVAVSAQDAQAAAGDRGQCLQREIDALNAAAQATLKTDQDLQLGKANAYHQLGEMGYNCQ